MRNYWLDRKAEREAFKDDKSSIEMSDAELLNRIHGFSPSQIRRYIQTLDKNKRTVLGKKIIIP